MKYFALEEEKNQFGEMTTTISIEVELFGDNRFRSTLTEMACRNGVLSNSCNCNSHQRWEKTPLSRKDTRDMLNEANIEIPEELEKALCDINPLDIFEQELALYTFLESSYAIKFNPLPYLRSYLSEWGYDVPVVFQYEPNGSGSGEVRVELHKGTLVVLLDS